MIKRNYAMDILVENATTFTDKSKINMLTESEEAVITNRMVGNIYQSALKRKEIDFESIPLSKGDIQKFQGYDNMIGTLSTVRQLSNKFGIKIEELDVVEDTISNIRTYKSVFERGFALDNEFLILFYNSLVYACVDSTSLILSSYVDYVKTVNAVEFSLRKGKGITGNLCIENLKKFNKSVKTGEFSRFANGMLDKNKQNFVGGAMAGKMALVAVLGVVPILRELVYQFYDKRMVLAEKLEQQATFLEMNAVRLKASDMPADKRNKVLAKQKDQIKKLEKYADKVRIDSQISNNHAREAIKKDNKDWTINTLSNDNSNGFNFI